MRSKPTGPETLEQPFLFKHDNVPFTAIYYRHSAIDGFTGRCLNNFSNLLLNFYLELDLGPSLSTKSVLVTVVLDIFAWFCLW